MVCSPRNPPFSSSLQRSLHQLGLLLTASEDYHPVMKFWAQSGRSWYANSSFPCALVLLEVEVVAFRTKTFRKKKLYRRDRGNVSPTSFRRLLTFANDSDRLRFVVCNASRDYIRDRKLNTRSRYSVTSTATNVWTSASIRHYSSRIVLLALPRALKVQRMRYVHDYVQMRTMFLDSLPIRNVREMRECESLVRWNYSSRYLTGINYRS